MPDIESANKLMLVAQGEIMHTHHMSDVAASVARHRAAADVKIAENTYAIPAKQETSRTMINAIVLVSIGGAALWKLDGWPLMLVLTALAGMAVAPRLFQILRANKSTSASFVAEHFRQLAKRWREETDTPSSDLNETLSNRSYLAIIAMGWPVVPCILSEMQRHADHWGPALEAITGENPVSDESEGDIEAISADWVAWGYRNHQLGSPDRRFQTDPLPPRRRAKGRAVKHGPQRASDGLG